MSLYTSRRPRADWAAWLAHDEVRPAHVVLALTSDSATPFPALVEAVRTAYPQLTPHRGGRLTFSRELRAAMADVAGFHAGATVEAEQLLNRLRTDPIAATALTRAGVVLPEHTTVNPARPQPATMPARSRSRPFARRAWR